MAAMQGGGLETQPYVGLQIFVPSSKPSSCFEKGVIRAVLKDGVLEVDLEGGAGSQRVKTQDCRDISIGGGLAPANVQDVAKLAYPNDASVLEVLRARYQQDTIYTYAGQLLVTVNPFRVIPGLYNTETLRKYKRSRDEVIGFPPTDLPAHVFAVAHHAATLFKVKKENQSCIVSGESGSGKTEAARHVMRYLAFDDTNGSDALDESPKIEPQSVQATILGSNCLLESFGNAKTLRNDNSSRFGRFIKLRIHPTGGIFSGEISEYMLELSRIDTQAVGERNYHIFYQLCGYLEESVRNECRFKTVSEYTFLNQSDTYSAGSVDDQIESQKVNAVLHNLLDETMRISLYKALSAVLLLGNLKFEDVMSKGIEASKLSEDSRSTLSDISDLLGVKSDALEHHFCVRQTEVQKSVVESPLTPRQAQGIAHTAAKDIYSALFSWLVQRVNERIRGPPDALESRWLGILDIYGFEYFKVNSLEQFLINYANEKLQQFFIETVFRSEIADYENEGIDHSMIVYEDNAPVIAILDGKKGSVLEFLEEQSLLATGTSEQFTRTCNDSLKQSKYYVKSKLNAEKSFGIRHSAAPVTYHTEEFVSKNRLKMPFVLAKMLREDCSNIAVKESMTRLPLSDPKAMKGQFVGSKFSVSMSKLLEVLRTSNAHFIRCVKPNEEKIAQNFNDLNVLNQLHCLSILEAILIVHKGFSYKAYFEDFTKDNKVLLSLLGISTLEEGDHQQVTVEALKRLAIPKQLWQMGKTRVFVRREGWLQVDSFMNKVLVKMVPCIIKMQSIIQSHFLREQSANLLTSLVRIQSLLRRFQLTKTQRRDAYLKRLFLGSALLLNCVQLRERRGLSAVVIQRWVRGRIVRKRYAPEIRKIRRKRFQNALIKRTREIVFAQRFKTAAQRAKKARAATRIQSAWRGYRSRQFVKKYPIWLKINKAAIRIQSLFRGHRVRQAVRWGRVLGPAATLIQAAWRAHSLRCKLEKTTPLGPRLRRLRRKQQKRMKILRVQRVARTFLVRRRIRTLCRVALFLQAHAAAILLKRKRPDESFQVLSLDQLREAFAGIVRIQSWFRGDRVRKVIREEKLRLLVSYNQDGDSMIDQREKKALQQYWKNLILKKEKGMLHPLFIAANHILQKTYPKGWLSQLPPVISDISCGAFHSIVLINSKPFAIGLNDKSATVIPLIFYLCRGQCGLAKGMSCTGCASLQPVSLREKGISVKRVLCGIEHCVLLTTLGDLYAWGSNERGQCAKSVSTRIVTKPHSVRFRNPSTKIVDFSVGGFHNAALDEDGSLWVWGRGDHLTIEGITERDIRAPFHLRLDFLWSQKGLVKIARVLCVVGATFVLSSNGQLFSWGSEKAKRLLGHSLYDGISSLVDIPEKVTDFNVGVHHGLALTEKGTVWTWGEILIYNPCGPRTK